MRIEGIDIYWVRLPLAFVWRTSYADQHCTDTILVRMEGGGHHAWGESCPVYIPAYSAEHTIATFHTLREHMAPRIVGQELESARDLLDRISFIKGNEFARAALDIGWWVLDAKRRGLPLHRALGGTRDRVAVGADFGIQDSLDILLEKIQGAIAQGFPRIKLKFRPGWDLHMVEAVRSTFPDFTFHVTYPADIFPSSYFYENDIGKPEIVLGGRGEVTTSQVPGIPQEPDPDLLKLWTVEHASFRARPGWPAAPTQHRSPGGSR